nr:hypothetical protein [Pseudarthrobacter psychrotolerans]
MPRSPVVEPVETPVRHPRAGEWFHFGYAPGHGAQLPGITSAVWATGYKLDVSILDVPVLDEWNYPRHSRGVTEHPGLYAAGLLWLTGQAAALVAGNARS